ncbi:MAG: hypothetical protein Fur0021_30020 [Candidatus Promineifilaceae bacterium]
MKTISLRIPEDVIEDLKRIAPQLGFAGYQPLIRAYIGQGLRADLEKLEEYPELSALIDSLRKQGIDDEVIATAVAEAKAGYALLEAPTVERFLSQVGILLAQRKTAKLPKREAELLQRINRGLPASLQQRYDELTTKLAANSLSSTEYEELTQMIDQIELADAERIQWLIELAQLRNLPLDELMDQLNIHHPPVYA